MIAGCLDRRAALEGGGSNAARTRNKMSVTFDEWKRAAATLGLELYGKAVEYAPGLSFSSLARAHEEPLSLIHI